MASPADNPYQLTDLTPYQQELATARSELGGAIPGTPGYTSALARQTQAEKALADIQAQNARIQQAQLAAGRVQNTADYNASRAQNAQDQLNLSSLKLDIANQTQQLKTMNDNWSKQVQAHQMSVQDWQNQFNTYKTQLDAQIQLYNTESARQTSLNTLAGSLTSDISRSVDAELPHLAAPGTTNAVNSLAAGIYGQYGLTPPAGLPAARASDIYPGGSPQDMVLNAYQAARQQVGDQAGFGTPPSVPAPVAPGAPPAPLAAPPPVVLPPVGTPTTPSPPTGMCGPGTAAGDAARNAEVGQGSATRPAYGFGRAPRLRAA